MDCVVNLKKYHASFVIRIGFSRYYVFPLKKIFIRPSGSTKTIFFKFENIQKVIDIKYTVKQIKSIFNDIFYALIKKEKYCCNKKMFYRFFIWICKNMLHFVKTADSHTTPLSGWLLIFIDILFYLPTDSWIWSFHWDTTSKFYQYKDDLIIVKINTQGDSN